MKPSAKVVLDLISRADGCCLWGFQDRRIGRFGARIFELRRLGYVISSKRCTAHPHEHHVERYDLVASPEASGQVALTLQEVPS